MANEIKTRIALKEDTLTKWQSSVFNGTDSTKYLKKGEVAITTVTTAKKDDRGNIIHVPCTLIKVGDGINKYDDLPWVSALAADVYEWAKKNEVSVTGNGNAITGASITDDTLSFVKGETFATKKQLDDALAQFGGDLDAITDNDHQYQFSIVTDNGTQKLKIEVKNVVNGAAASWTELTKIDIVGHADLTNALSNYYTKEEVNGLISGVNQKIDNLDESVTTVAKGTAIDVTDAGTGNDHAYTVGLNVDGAKTALGLKSAAYVTVDSLNTTAQGYADDVKAGVENGTIKVKDAEHADAAGKVDKDLTIKVGGKTKIYNGSAEVEADVDAAISAAVNAKHIPEYSIVKDATSDYAATYHLTKDGTNIGTAINIPKDMVVESGEVKTLEAGTWGGAGTYIVLTLSNATNDKLYINVGDLIEYVTSGSTTNDAIVVAIDDDHKVTASITDGKITKAKLETSVQTTLTNADTAYEWGNHASQGYLKSGDIANKVDKVNGTSGNFVAFDANGAIKDSGKKASSFATSAQGTKADNALPANGWETGGTTLQRIDSGYSIQLNPQWIRVGDSNRGVDIDEWGVKVCGDKNQPYSNTTYADGKIERYDGITIDLPSEDGILALTKNVKAKRAAALDDSYANGQVVVAVDQDVDGNITSEKKDVAQALSDSSNIQYLVFDCGSATEVV